MNHQTYWEVVRKIFRRHRLGMCALFVVILFTLVGIYAPFLASSKPLVVNWDGTWYFPLFRNLFFRGFYTKRIDLFFNLLMFTFPFFILFRKRFQLLVLLMTVQVGLFAYLAYTKPQDPAVNPAINLERQLAIQNGELSTWNFELRYMISYAKLNLVLQYNQRKNQHLKFQRYKVKYENETGRKMSTLWQIDLDNEKEKMQRLKKVMNHEAQAEMAYILERRKWLREESAKLYTVIMPLFRSFHWEEDAGGEQSLNRMIKWWDLTRINRKDLMAALIFGVRISLVVGLLAVGLSLLIGIPIGSLAGFYGGKLDILVTRLMEIWESMPVFFMLLLIVAITQNKSIFLVITVIGFFSWPGFSRYIRGEFFKQRNLPYVEACHSLGFRDSYIIFSHILPNAIPPVLTLLPFSIMGAITSEAGLSFLGLGEEGSCSWGVLMDEGRTAFPGESYLLWPPAILLTILLVAIALVGDALRDALDPKMHR